MELITDNNAFNSAEFRRFAEQYDFKHTTSSPHYAQANGRSEASVKVCKQLMEKAIEDREDPHLALLAWRNTPSEHLGQSPAELIFGRRTRTHMPMAPNCSLAHESAKLRERYRKLRKNKQHTITGTQGRGAH